MDFKETQTQIQSTQIGHSEFNPPKRKHKEILQASIIFDYNDGINHIFSMPNKWKPLSLNKAKQKEQIKPKPIKYKYYYSLHRL